MWPHLNDPVAAGLEIIEDLRDSVRSCVLEVAHQDDALAVLLELGDHRLSHLLGTAHFKVEGIKVGREDSYVARAEIGERFRRLL